MQQRITAAQSLEQYLIDTGMVSMEQLLLAKKVQQQQQGPLMMILLRLCFIDLDQMNGLMRIGFALGM
jgi:hypothetical protein